jgi:hypothetical protein
LVTTVKEDVSSTRRRAAPGLPAPFGLDGYAPRLLGVAFLLVIVTSLVSGLLIAAGVGSGSSVIGTGRSSQLLVDTSKHLTIVRIGVVGDLITSAGIIALAALLYIVLRGQSRVLALIALGWWLAEGIMMATSRIGALALTFLSSDFVNAGSPAHSYYQSLGALLYNAVYMRGYTAHMLFYCLGGLLWYYLFYRSRYVPRILSLFGIAAVAVGLVGIVAEFFNVDVPTLVYIPIGLFELVIGLWLLLRGIPAENSGAPATRSSSV